MSSICRYCGAAFVDEATSRECRAWLKADQDESCAFCGHEHLGGLGCTGTPVNSGGWIAPVPCDCLIFVPPLSPCEAALLRTTPIGTDFRTK